MDSLKYTQKCLNILDSEQFLKIYDDPTKRVEGKIQRCIRKLKTKVSKDDYLKTYPTASSPGKFYANARCINFQRMTI